MTSKVLLHKVPPVSKQRSYLPLNALQASFLSWDTAQPSRKLQPAQGASFTTGQRVTRHVTASDSTTEPPLVLATPSGTSNSLLIRHKNLRRTEITRLYARLYAAGPMLLLALGSGHGGGRLAAAAAAAALPPAAGRPRGAGPRAGAGLRALGGATFAAAPFLVLISHLKTKLPTI